MLLAIPLCFIMLVIFYATKGLVPFPLAAISILLIILFSILVIRKKYSTMYMSDLSRIVTTEEIVPEEECDSYV